VSVLPVAEWRPDMPALANATEIASNVVPRTSESYGPFSDLASYTSNALNNTCLGLVAVQATDLSIVVFAGTADKLYDVTSLTATWNDVSGATYNTAEGDNWHFALFANALIATNFADPLQSFELGVSSTFGNLFTASAWQQSHAYGSLGAYVLANGNRYVLTQTGTSASSGTGPSGTGFGITDGTCVWDYQSSPPPQARFVCTPKNFVMVANTLDGAGGLGPARAWWSANGDATSWPAPGTAQAQAAMSDYNDFRGNLGEITGLVDSLANADVAIFFRHAVWRGQFVGPPDVFDFFPAENVRGCPCPNGIVALGSLVYYPAEDGFYVFDGAVSTPIGTDKFDKWFWTNVNQGFLGSVIGAADVINKAIIWIFPSLASSSGIPDTALVWRWDIQRASMASINAQWVARLLSFGVSLDGFSSLGFTDLDTLPYSLDARVWIGGALQLGAVDRNKKLAFFNGNNLAAQVGLQTVQFIPGRRAYVQSARPLIELSAGTPTIAFAGQTNLYDPIVYGAATAPDASGECPQRSDARYHTAALSMPAAAVWTHISGADVTFTSAGLR
jgi:hypothetical protein